VSSQTSGAEVDLRSVNGEAVGDGGVAHGAALIAFVDAAMGEDDARLERARADLRAVLSPAAYVDACAVVGAFNIVDRIADATGIPLDAGLDTLSAEVRSELALARFAASKDAAGDAG
jgi:hypothetical protein